jgi:hypothetical protein
VPEEAMPTDTGAHRRAAGDRTSDGCSALTLKEEQTMDRSRHMLTTLGVVALLASLMPSAVAQDAAKVPPAAALSTGQRVYESGTDFTEVLEGNGVVTERGRTMEGYSEMSDARLSGEVVIKDQADRFFDAMSPAEDFLGDVLWGTVEITNDGGSWSGTSVGTTDATADGAGVGYFELVGVGGYEGLSAVIFEREVWDPETRTGTYLWSGVIFPGTLPPDR